MAKQIHQLAGLTGNIASSDVFAVDTGTVTRSYPYGTLAGAIVEQYNGSTVGGKAQTLKAAIDALAGVLSDAEIRKIFTGNVIVAPASGAGEIGGLMIYGKSVQSGTPTPSVPVDIVTAGDSETLTIYDTSGNIFDPAFLLGASGWSFNGEMYSGDAYALWSHFNNTHWTPNTPSETRLTISGRALVPQSVSYPRFVFNYTDGSTQNVSLTTGSSINAFSGTSEVGKTVDYITFTYSGSGSTTISLADVHVSIGTKNVGCDYVTPIAATLSTSNGLPGVPVDSGGNHTDTDGQRWVCDIIDLEAGVWVKRCHVRTITSIFNVESEAPNRPYFFIRNVDDTADINDGYIAGETETPAVIADYLPRVPRGQWWTGTMDGITITSRSNVVIRLPGCTTKDQANAYLAEHPLTIVYAQAAPEVTQLTQAQITALKALKSFDGGTALFTTDDAQPDLRAKIFVNAGAYI